MTSADADALSSEDDLGSGYRTALGTSAATTWQALSAFATEQHHALLHAFDNAPLETTGHIQHQQEASTTDQNSPRLGSAPAERSLEAELAPEFQRFTGDTEAIQSITTEVDRIQKRIAILNPATDVVVRIDFIQGFASRAASLAVMLSLLVAATVLITQVVKKFQLGNAQYEYKHTAMYKAHTAVATVCLTVLTVVLANLLWNVFGVVRQKKSW